MTEALAKKISSLATRLRITADFVEGLAYLRSTRIVRANLSVLNALLFDNYQIKLSNFRGAGHLETDDDSIEALRSPL